jgi:hypothetical protein
MKTILAIVAAAALGSSLAFAQDKDKKPSDKQLAQQQRMKDCNAQAGKKDMKGDERKAFMSKCLAGDKPSAKQAAQQDKMKSCNAQASKKALKGDERKAFMSKCLSA